MPRKTVASSEPNRVQLFHCCLPGRGGGGPCVILSTWTNLYCMTSFDKAPGPPSTKSHCRVVGLRALSSVVPLDRVASRNSRYLYVLATPHRNGSVWYSTTQSNNRFGATTIPANTRNHSPYSEFNSPPML